MSMYPDGTWEMYYVCSTHIIQLGVFYLTWDHEGEINEGLHCSLIVSQLTPPLPPSVVSQSE